MGFAEWIEAERGRFILLLPVAMAAAILIYFCLPVEPPLWFAAALPAAGLAALIAGWRFLPTRFAGALLLAGTLGFARAESRTAAEPPLIVVPYGAPQITGQVVAVDLLPVGRRLTIAAPRLDAAAPLSRMVRIRLRNSDATPVAVDDEVTLRARLFRLDRPAYPGAWDFGRDAFFQGLGASGYALGDIAVIRTGIASAGSTWLRGLRDWIAANILAVLPTPTGSVAVTLLTGFEQVMPAAERQNFIAAGLAHILAVAGLHVGIVMALFFGATRFAITRSERLTLHLPVKAISAIAALFGGGAYACLTGAHLPILRSLAMASLVTLGVLAGRRAISLRGLALAAMAIMLATPEAVVGVSFQMSFSAVAALIAGYAAAQPGFAILHRGPFLARAGGHVLALAFTSLLAGGASMPFAAYQFQQVQPYWIAANLIAVPLTALWIMPLGLAALALMPFGLAAIALLPMGWGIAVIVWLTAAISAWPHAMLQIAKTPDPAICCYAAGLAWLCIWRSRVRLAGIALMLAGAVLYAAARPPDILVSPDARLIAIRTAPGIILFRQPKAAAFVLASWQAEWAGTPFLNLDPAAPPAGNRCNTDACQIATPAGGVTLALVPPLTSCGDGKLVVSPEPLRHVCDRPDRVVIDRFSVWRNGAIAVWIRAHGVATLSDRQVQGARPWVPPWPEWKPSTTLN